jgi:hypothetical protein
MLELLTTPWRVVILSNMKAEPLLDERLVLAENAFVELVVWQVPSPVLGSAHGFKYRLALVVEGVCVLRYDNEAGKGDHKHLGGEQTSYTFTTPAQLLADFWDDVDRWRA